MATWSNVNTNEAWDLSSGSVTIKYSLDKNSNDQSYDWISEEEDGDYDLFHHSVVSWQNVSNVTFVEDNSNPQYLFLSAEISGGDGFTETVKNIFSGKINSATSFIEPSFNIFRNELIALHEIGHVLGLGIYDANNNENGNNNELNQSMTVMSYNEFESNNEYPTTPMYFDILAIQQKYGVNGDHYSNDSVYDIESNYSLFSIWDAGGENDLISASTTSTENLIDLRSSSTIATASNGILEYGSNVGNAYFGVAYGSHIENVNGGSGNDTIYGSDIFSADTIGNAEYEAHDGGNLLAGHLGNDSIYGLSGNDTLFGGPDSIASGTDSDTLYGDAGTDLHINSIMTDGGDDVLHGGAEADTLYGEAGHDRLYGDDGNDYLVGGNGDDWLEGGAQVDVLYGGHGSDILIGGEGPDAMYGGNGFDLYEITQQDSVLGYQHDTVRDVDGKGLLAITLLNGTKHYLGNINATYSATLQGWEYDNGQISFTMKLDGDDLVIRFDADNLVTIKDFAGSRAMALNGSKWLGITLETPPYDPADPMDGSEGGDEQAAGDEGGFSGGLHSNANLIDANYEDSGSASGSGGTGLTLVGDQPDYVGGPNVVRNDHLRGGAGDDYIVGLNGNDMLVGGAGNDEIYGGGQSGDVAYGGDGNDYIESVSEGYGGAGSDFIYAFDLAVGESGYNYLRTTNAGSRVIGGDDGNNVHVYSGATGATITTGNGHDMAEVYASGVTAELGNGNNTIVGGNDMTITTGDGHDTIHFGYGNSSNTNTVVHAGGGDNSINTSYSGLWGNLTVTAGAGDDVINGAFGNSNISAGDGANYISVMGTSSTIITGSGNDTFVLRASNVNIIDAGGNSTVNVWADGQELTLTHGNTVIQYLGYSNGRMSSEVGGNTITTGSGNDQIYLDYAGGWQPGSDNTIDAGDGNNTVRISGAFSNSSIKAGDGEDILTGSAYADDTIEGGGGIDVLSGGGGGDDIFIFGSGDSGTGGAADTIYNFGNGTKIDLSSFGDLDFVGATGFSGALSGEVGYTALGSNTLVRIDHDGDGLADSEIMLVGVTAAMTASDFIL